MSTQDASRSLIEAYLPRTLIDYWTRAPQYERIWSLDLEGCLMLCDMSGFTAMSERLARLGKEGAELMAGILNRFFSRMLDIAEGWGGVQMKFGGDAMLLFFDADGDGAERRGAACALEMQQAMTEFQSVRAGGEQHRLRMRIGVHFGHFFSASAGDPSGVLHYVLMGADVNATAAVEGHAKPGQVVASAACAARLRAAGARLSPAESGCFRVLGVEAARPADVSSPARRRDDVLRQYIMRPLADRLAQGDTRPGTAEHRRVTAIFINLLGVAESLARSGAGETLTQVDRYLKMVLRSLDKHGGYLAASDAAETGDKLIILFGAPIASERDEVSALRFLIDLRDEVRAARMPLDHRIGMSTGFVFAGEIGSPARREYTVIGDTVNVAARLMGAARRGEIYVAAATAERAMDEFELRPLRPLHVKGKSEPLRAFRLMDARAPRAAPEGPQATKAVVGRDAEIERLTGLAQRANEGGAWAFVCGEPGIGKSTLVAHAAGAFERDGCRWIATRCQSQGSGTVLGAWTQLLSQLLGLDSTNDPRERWTKLRDGIRDLQPARASFAPLVADLLSLPSDREPMLEFMDARQKRTLLNATIIGVVRAAASRQPLLLTFDDLHVADAPSRELLAEFLKTPSSGCLTIVSARGRTLPPELSSLQPDELLSLSELPEAAARSIAAASGASDERVIAAIIARAQGNPMFIEEMVLTSSAAVGELPLTINEVILARLDRLPHEEKAVLKAASVAGVTFAKPQINVLLDDHEERVDVDGALARLAEGGFVRNSSDGAATHAFSHILTQEVAYETLLYAQRRELHGTLGSHIEREQASDLGIAAGMLLYHFDRAGNVPKTVTYGVLTGERAARVFANREAIDHYMQALDALQRIAGHHESDRSQVLERIGECLEMEGRHRAATEAFSDSLTAWRAARPRRASILRRDRAADRARESALCRSIAVSHERRSEYDASLAWLDEAQRLLPKRSAAVGSEVWASRGMALYRKGMYRDAVESGKRALTLARQSRDPRRIAYAQNMLANSYLEEGSVRLAVRQLEQAIKTYAAIGDVYGTAAANNNIGNCYQALGNLDTALQHYEIALEANLRVGNDATIVHNNMGETLLMRGSVREAAIHLQEVVRAHESDPDLNAVAGLSHVNLSRCMVALGDLAAADEHLREGTRLLTEVGAEGLLAEARLQAAALKLIRGHAREAVSEATSVLGEAEAANAQMLILSAQRVVGSALVELGRDGEAIEQLAAGVALARRIGAHHEEARLLVELARVRKNEHREWSRAAADLRRARRLLSAATADADLIEMAERLGDEIALARTPRRRAIAASDGHR